VLEENGPIGRGAPVATYEETRRLSGQALADALGLEPLDVPRGQPIGENDPRLGKCAKGASDQPAGTVSTGPAVYCLAGVVKTDFQEWDVSQRLAGFGPPYDLEVRAFLLTQRSERVAAEGEEQEARGLSSKAHDLKLQAAETAGCGERVAAPASS
jgi:hypothetical protein